MPDDSRRPDEQADPADQAEPQTEIAELREELDRLRADLEDFETDVEDRTVDRAAVEAELKGYVRRRVHTARARGWGPYLVLLYGTAMTIGAFYYLQGGWAILAMLVIWLSTLGLYVFMVVVGTGLAALGIPGRLWRRIANFRR